MNVPILFNGTALNLILFLLLQIGEANRSVSHPVRMTYRWTIAVTCANLMNKLAIPFPILTRIGQQTPRISLTAVPERFPAAMLHDRCLSATRKVCWYPDHRARRSLFQPD